jgi:3-oxoacyl-[acyl-carrier protein] reductase
MDLMISNKVALVFGASKGLGKAIAAALVREGATVVIASRNREQLEKALEETGAAGFFTVDLQVEGDGVRVVEETAREYGSVDIVVTNSGGPPNGLFDDIDNSIWKEQYQNLFLSPIEIIRAVRPHMKQKKWGRILLVTSVTAKEPISGLTISNGLRAGLMGLVKSLSNESASDNITVNALLPGYTRTERLIDLNINEEKICEEIPAKRLGRPEEFGNLACFLASEKAGYITGQMIACDGGYLKGY